MSWDKDQQNQDQWVFPSRVLNEQRGLFGLGMKDLVLAIAIMTVATPVLERFKLQILSIPLACLSLLILVPIRLKYREHIIRDTIWFYFTPRRLHVSRVLSRNQSHRSS